MEFFSVGVKNVQSIESLEFEFPVRESGGSFVTFVGPSSSGKSALLRAVHALVNNTSSAAVLLRSGAKQFEVEGTTKNGHVCITRGSSLSTYTLGEEKYTKAGTSVPEDVQKFLGFKDPDLHLRFQFDRPYLLDATSGQAATALARLSHAHILRDAAAKASKIVRKQSSDLAVLESEKVSAQQALTDLGDVEAQGLQVEQILQAAQDIQNTISRAAQVQTALTSIVDLSAALEDAQRALSLVPDLSEEFMALQQGVDWFGEVAREVQTYSNAVENSSQVVPEVAKSAQPLLQLTQEKFSAFGQLSDHVLTHIRAIEEVSFQKQELGKAEADVKAITAKVEQVRATLEICPACGQEVA